MPGVGLQCDAPARPGRTEHDPGRDQIDQSGRHGHRNARTQRLEGLRIEKPLYGSVGDAQRGKTDQDAFDSAGKILDLSVTVGMPSVGRTPGLDDGQQSDEPRRQIDHGLHGVGKKADGIRQKEGSELESHGQNRSPDGQPGVSADTGGHFSSSRHRRN